MFLLLLALLGFAPAEAAWLKFDAFRLQFVDEGERDTSFKEFRYKLSRALETRDLGALKGMVAPTISNELGKSGTLAEFLKTWKLEDPASQRDSEIWNKLRDAVRLGGSFDGGEFRAPYVFSRWPQRYPPFDFYAVLAKNTPVHQKPQSDSRVLETLTQEIVGRFDALPNGPGWRAVRTPSGTTGYVADSLTRSPLDYRAIFRKLKGEWKLVEFASGDWEAHERLE
jgi:hypothetical protein